MVRWLAAGVSMSWILAGLLVAADPAVPGASTASPEEARQERTEALWLRRSEGPAWSVVDGRGIALDAQAFADRTQDEALARQLVEERSGVRRRATRMVIGAVALMALSPVAMLGVRDTWHVGSDDPRFGSRAGWNDVAVCAGGLVFGTGALLLTAALAESPRLRARQRSISAYRSAPVVDAQIARHNQGLVEVLRGEAPVEE
jgi:hypothetical protein